MAREKIAKDSSSPVRERTPRAEREKATFTPPKVGDRVLLVIKTHTGHRAEWTVIGEDRHFTKPKLPSGERYVARAVRKSTQEKLIERFGLNR